MPLNNRFLRQFLLCCLMLATLPVAAQAPKWQKKARKAQVSLITYDASGLMLHATAGVFVSTDGVALADYKSFQGAARAVAFDESGREWPVECIMGANSLYDVVKVKVAIPKTAALTIAPAAGRKGDKAYVLPYPSNTAGNATATTLADVSTFNDDYAYYTLPVRLSEKWNACPVMNEAGELIGLLQMPAQTRDTCCYAVSAVFADSLRTQALSAASSDYQAIPMKKMLPREASQAHTFIYLTGARDTALYRSYIDDYITLFPKESNGYTLKADLLTEQGRYAEAEQTWDDGIRAHAPEDELRYARASTLAHVVTGAAGMPENWNLDRALQEVEAAQALHPLPLYQSLKAKILYGLRRYVEAAALFTDLNQTNLRSADNFLYAAQCQQMLGDTAAVLALQDSAVACFTRPYVEAAAPSLLMRSNTLLSLGRYRDAVRDLNDYEHLKANDLNANFYYRREQAEMRCRMFQQALNDIEQAVRLEPREPLFQAELAAVHYRFNQLDEAIAAAHAAIALDETFADAHRILGICLRAQGKEAEGQSALQQAADLGDEVAKALLQANTTP